MNSHPSLFLIFLWMAMVISIGLFTIRSLQSSTNQSVYAVEPCTTPTPTPTPTPSASPAPTATPAPTTSPTPSPTAAPIVQNVYLTEFMACPASGNEWLELYNANTSALSVVNWQVVDETGNKKYLNGVIPASDFMKFEWTGSLLNNTGDSFTVITGTGQTIGTASYDSCSTGVSFVYEAGEWVGALDTPGEETVISTLSLPQSTAAALLTSATHAASDTGQLASNFLKKTTNSNQASPPFVLPNLLTTDPTPTKAEPLSSKSLHNSWPAISVIMGGLVQLLPSSALLYENTKKYFS